MQSVYGTYIAIDQDALTDYALQEGYSYDLIRKAFLRVEPDEGTWYSVEAQNRFAGTLKWLNRRR